MTDAPITPEDFVVLVRRAGLTLDEAQIDDLLQAYSSVQAMVARVRTPRGREAEPAHVFALPSPGAER